MDRIAARLLVSTASAFAVFACMPAGATAADWRWPVRGPVLTAYRNGGDPYAAGQHRGIDIAAPRGTTVAAATAGKVRFAGQVGSSGLIVSIRTADGRWDTSYLHLAGADVVAGQRVRVGQRIGVVGTSGHRSASAPHLHFGVRVAGRRTGYVDPLDLLPPVVPPARRPTPAPAPLPVVVPSRPVPARVPVRRRPIHVPDRGRVPRRMPVPGVVAVPRTAPGFAAGHSLTPVAEPHATARPTGEPGLPLGRLLLGGGALIAAAALAAPRIRRREDEAAASPARVLAPRRRGPSIGARTARQ